MGRKLDALLGRGFNTTKFKTLVNLAISRLAVLKNQRQFRCSQTRSDVIQLLNLGHHERALLRVEQVIKEQNMLDAFVMIEGYCHLLIERVLLIANNKECPDELKEAISGLIFAASRCGEFPELQEIRYLFTSRYGKDFAGRAVELRNNCGVNPRIIQKFSTRQPSLESRIKLLKEIASENGITLKLQEESTVITEEVKVDVNHKQNEPKPEPPAKSDINKHVDKARDLIEVIERNEQFSESIKAPMKYRDVVSAAQAAFESAAYAAAAARAAVKLSQAESHDKDPDDDDPGSPPSKFHPSEFSSSDSEGDESAKSHMIHTEEWEERKNKAELVRSMSVSSSSSVGGILNETVFDESDSEKKKEDGTNGKSSFARNEFQRTQLSTTVAEEDHSDLNDNIKKMPMRSQDNIQKHLYDNKVAMGSRNIGGKPVSVRTRRA